MRVMVGGSLESVVGRLEPLSVRPEEFANLLRA